MADSGSAPAKRTRRADRIGVSREKERMSWELFVNGASYQQIAATRHPGTGQPLYGSEGAARAAVFRARQYMANEEEVELVRAQRLAGLQAQRLDCMRQMGRVQPLLGRNGEPVMRRVERADGTVEMVPQEDQAVRMQIHRTLVQIDKQIAALTGTDAAQRFEMVAPATPAQRDEMVADLKARAATITLLPRKAIDVSSVETDREGTG